MHRFKVSTLGLMIALSLFVQQRCVAQETDHVQFIPSSAMLAIMAKPKDAISQPSMELFPYEVVSAMGKKELGFDPCTITQFSFIVDTFADMERPPEAGAVIEFAQPQKIEDLSENLLYGMEKGTMDGKTVYAPEYESDGPMMMQYSDTMIIISTKPFLRKMLNARGAQSKLLSLIAQQKTSGHFGMYMTMEPVRGLIKDNLPPANQVPPMFRNFLELPDLIDSVTLRSDFSDEGSMALSINTATEEDTKRMQEIMMEGMEMGKQMALMQIEESMSREDPVLRDSVQQYANRVANYLQRHVQPGISDDGKSMVFETEEGNGAASAATIGILTGMLLPAVQQVREAARRTSSANNLRQLALACFNYESVHRSFPSQAIFSEDGRPLLSWRVKILPYLDEQALYEKFRLDEPWDSEHNIQLLDEMPEVFLNPNSIHRNKTGYLALKGEGTFMDGTDGPNRIASFVDGTSNTIMFVEADDDVAVEWTKPADLPFNPENPMRGLGGLRPAGFNAAFCDGSVQFIDRSIDWEMLRRMAIRNDGKVVDR